MKKDEGKGKLIVFEGINGAGKTTMTRLASKYLAAKGLPVSVYKSPSQMAGAVFSACNGFFLDEFEKTMIYMIDLRKTIRQINTSLEIGVNVIADRLTLSNFVYNVSSLRGKDVKKMQSVYSSIFADVRPDITFLFDCPVNKTIERTIERIDMQVLSESEALMEEYAEKAKIRRYLYLECRDKSAERYIVIDASKSKKKTWNELKKHLSSVFNIQ